jgi:hypothetical protein
MHFEATHDPLPQYGSELSILQRKKRHRSERIAGLLFAPQALNRGLFIFVISKFQIPILNGRTFGPLFYPKPQNDN